MAKPHPALKIAAALLAAGVAVWMVCNLFEPSYQGKRLSAWLDEAVRNGDINLFGMDSSGRESPPAKAVLAIGPRGVPQLLSLIRAKDTPLRKKFRELAQKYKLMPNDVRHNPDYLHAMGAYGFWVLGPAANSAVPQLIKSLDDDDADVRAAAAYTLSFIGPADVEALPALEDRLTALSQSTSSANDWPNETYGVLRTLGEMGPQARSALPQITLLSQRPSDLRAPATAARIKISGDGLESAIEPLRNPSAETNWQLACGVAFVLGSDARLAVPLLVENLKSTNQEIQAFALSALGRIHSDPLLCLPAMAPFLSSSNKMARLPALVGISTFGLVATKWVPMSLITSWFTDPDEDTRKAATNALRQLYPEAAAKLSVK